MLRPARDIRGHSIVRNGRLEKSGARGWQTAKCRLYIFVTDGQYFLREVEDAYV